MEPWQSWVLLGIIVVGAFYHYTTTGQKKRPRGRGTAIIEPNHQTSSKSRNESKDKKKKEKDSTSDNVTSDVADATSSTPVKSPVEAKKNKRKNAKKAPSKLAQSSAVEVSSEQKQQGNPALVREEAEQEEVDNADFARQLSKAQAGTSLKKPSGPTESGKGKKKTKQTRAALEVPNGSAKKQNGEIGDAQEMSRTSSTTGAEADDDLSPNFSPELEATSTKTPNAADVTDMLEAPSKGPSILRLTEPQNPEPPRQPKPKRVAPEPETKKQRQNRRKREEQKAVREEAEKERRVLLEKQLRTAREAEGRPAKNGLGSLQTFSGNAWSGASPGKKDVVDSNFKADPQPLLDTLDDSQSAGSSNSKGASLLESSYQTSYPDLPSEEEQLRILSELDSDNAWSTVDKGGKAKKKVKNTPQSATTNLSSSSTKEYLGAPSGVNRASANKLVKQQTFTSHDFSNINHQQSSTLGNTPKTHIRDSVPPTQHDSSKSKMATGDDSTSTPITKTMDYASSVKGNVAPTSSSLTSVPSGENKDVSHENDTIIAKDSVTSADDHSKGNLLSSKPVVETQSPSNPETSDTTADNPTTKDVVAHDEATKPTSIDNDATKGATPHDGIDKAASIELKSSKDAPAEDGASEGGNSEDGSARAEATHSGLIEDEATKNVAKHATADDIAVIDQVSDEYPVEFPPEEGWTTNTLDNEDLWNVDADDEDDFTPVWNRKAKNWHSKPKATTVSKETHPEPEAPGKAKQLHLDWDRRDDGYYDHEAHAVRKARWKKIGKKLDRNVWNHDNIHTHPEYHPSFPYMLLGHPLDSDWVAHDTEWSEEMDRVIEECKKRKEQEKAGKGQSKTLP